MVVCSGWSQSEVPNERRAGKAPLRVPRTGRRREFANHQPARTPPRGHPRRNKQHRRLVSVLRVLQRGGRELSDCGQDQIAKGGSMSEALESGNRRAEIDDGFVTFLRVSGNIRRSKQVVWF